MPLAKVITVAAVAGNMIACAAFLHAERYFPAGIEDRRFLTAAVFFGSWLAALIHAGVRPYHRAWIEQLGFTALLCLTLPFASANVGVGLPVSIARDDWIRAGVDLTVAALGVMLASGAWAIGRRRRQENGAP